jgi:hypothetical protein
MLAPPRIDEGRSSAFDAIAEGRPLRVAVAAPQNELYENVALSLADDLSALGHAVRRVEDGDRQALEADWLVMLGNASTFRKFPPLVRARGQHRPATLVWQLEKLPPPDISSEADALGQRIHRPDWAAYLGPAGTALDRIGRPRGIARRVAQRLLARRMLRLLKLPSACADELCPQTFQVMFAQAEWFRMHAAADGGWLDAIAVSAPARIDYLRRMGLESQFVSVGYHAAWGAEQPVPRDIDVLFLGRTPGRRRRWLDKLKRDLAAKGHRLTVVDRGCFGAERTALVSRAKVVLNLQAIPWEWAGMRMLFSIGCGALVVSERSAAAANWVEGLHFVGADLPSLPDTIARWLADEPARLAFTHQARQSMLAVNSSDRVAAQLLDLVRQAAARRAAA